ncbi:MAG: lipase family protein [Pseudolabrys sp.]
MDKAERSLKKFWYDLQSTWTVLERINWLDPAFAVEKAYVCAVFSKAAYLKIPDFELADADKAKVIPCLTYQYLIREGRQIDVVEYLRTADFSNVFVEFNERVVVVGIVLQNVIIVAFRGTRPLYLSDWMTDFNSFKVEVTPDTNTVSFHKGFYLSISSIFESIGNHLQKKLQLRDMPVYVVGHSLGGAMAAILYALGGRTFYSRYMYEAVNRPVPSSHSSFTVGMPRYGDKRAVASLRNPYHCYNVLDVVPNLPFHILGFEDSQKEYMIRGGKLIQNSRRGGLSPWALFPRLHYARGIRHHLIERYIVNLKSIVGIR